MRTINLIFKCSLEQCKYNYPNQCIDSEIYTETEQQNNWICPYLNAYITPQTQPPATPECIHRQHTCNECKTDHKADYIFCQSPKKMKP